jgi:hypothetical protein
MCGMTSINQLRISTVKKLKREATNERSHRMSE